jgi:ubiquinone/menaquinone biosynthesis C-methylase UbiE
MRRTPPNFNFIARPYRWFEYLTLGKSLENCRNHFLLQLLDRRHALVLGDGDGRFLAQLLKQNPDLHADAVDISTAMLQLLRKRCKTATPNAAVRLRTHHANAITIPLQPGYDLVVTHFFLDCFTTKQLQTLLPGLAHCLRPGALWVISDFNIPATRPFAARLLVATLYRAFGLLTGLAVRSLPEYPPLLGRIGFVLLERRSRLAGLLISELWLLPPDRAPNR